MAARVNEYNEQRTLPRNTSGQTGYTTHILDGMVIEILHQILDRMNAASEDEIVSRTQINVTMRIKDQCLSPRDFAVQSV